MEDMEYMKWIIMCLLVLSILVVGAFWLNWRRGKEIRRLKKDMNNTRTGYEYDVQDDVLYGVDSIYKQVKSLGSRWVKFATLDHVRDLEVRLKEVERVLVSICKDKTDIKLKTLYDHLKLELKEVPEKTIPKKYVCKKIKKEKD